MIPCPFRGSSTSTGSSNPHALELRWKEALKPLFRTWRSWGVPMEKALRFIVVLLSLPLPTGCIPGSAAPRHAPGGAPATDVVATGSLTAKRIANCAPIPTNPATSPAPGTAAVPPRALDESVIRYLRCTDFNCADALHAVVAVGPSLIPQLSQLLQRGAPTKLAAELPGDASRTVGLKAVAALGALGDPRAIVALIGTLRNPDPLLRAETARALGGFSGNHEALTVLLPLLSDFDPLVRETTVEALQRIGCGQAVAALHDALDTEPADYIRRAIEKALQALEAR